VPRATSRVAYVYSLVATARHDSPFMAQQISLPWPAVWLRDSLCHHSNRAALWFLLIIPRFPTSQEIYRPPQSGPIRVACLRVGSSPETPCHWIPRSPVPPTTI